MMWKEFEQIAGYEVSYKTYSEIIEPMYMAICDRIDSKADFIKLLDKKALALPSKAAMLRSMRQQANEIFEGCGVRSYWKEKEALRETAYSFASRFFGIDRNSLNDWAYLNEKIGYRGCVMQHGSCYFPYELVIGRNNTELARIELVKL